MKFSALVLCSMLFSVNSFAETSEVKCFKELRALRASIAKHTVATDRVAADSLDSANFVMNMAVSLIAQSNTRVGAYGYSVQRNAQIMLDNVNSLQQGAKTAEAEMDTKANEVEDCLINM